MAMCCEISPDVNERRTAQQSSEVTKMSFFPSLWEEPRHSGIDLLRVGFSKRKWRHCRPFHIPQINTSPSIIAPLEVTLSSPPRNGHSSREPRSRAWRPRGDQLDAESVLMGVYELSTEYSGICQWEQQTTATAQFHALQPVQIKLAIYHYQLEACWYLTEGSAYKHCSELSRYLRVSSIPRK